jgi:hypothetical protein
MPHVYGDSTPFPYDVDYIDLSRLAVECAVQLMSAQHSIATSLERAEALGRERRAEVERISAMSRAAAGAVAPFLREGGAATERIARRLLECVESTAAAEVASLDQQSSDESSHIRHIVTRSGESAHRALEGFLLRHDLPGTLLCLSWASAGDQSYSANVTVKTPFGIVAAFSLAIPPDHLWSRSRRVAELLPAGLEVHFPQQAGWLSKRVEMAPLKLDRLFISKLELDVSSAELILRKTPSSGSGYRIVVRPHDEKRVSIQPLGDDGAPEAASEEPLSLDGEDSAIMLAFCARVVESTRDLAGLRRSMVSVEYDGKPLDEARWPEVVASRLIAELAPVVNEIALRSGAPGELVLRRDVGGGRREEVYVTKAELYERVLVLPPERRVSFERLGLYDPLRPAPAPLLPHAGPYTPSFQPAPLPGPAQ